jgi:catalase
VLPDGEDAVQRLRADGHTMEFITLQYRHCKSILALGASGALLEQADISPNLPSGEPDPGVAFAAADAVADAVDWFVGAIAKHRHVARDSDPPLI